MGTKQARVLIIVDREGSSIDMAHTALTHQAERLALEVNAAVKGAKAARVKEIYVRDRTKNGHLLAEDRIDKKVQVIKGGLFPGCGIEWKKAVNCAFLLGLAPQNPSISDDSTIRHDLKIKINGEWMDELGLITLALAEHHVSTILISGDSNTARNYKNRFPHCQMVITKNVVNGSAVRSLHPEEIEKRFEIAAKAAISQFIGTQSIFPNLPGHYEVEIIFPHALDVALLTLIPWVRADEAEKSLHFYLSSMTQVYQFLFFIRSLPGLP